MYKKLLFLVVAVLIVGRTSNGMAFDGQLTANDSMTFEGASLRSENSYKLYDFDIYDDVIDLGDLGKVGGHYLFTNLHNSSGLNDFQLGYAGKIFNTDNAFQSGTLSLLYNRSTSESENIDKLTDTDFVSNTDGSGNQVTLEKNVAQDVNVTENELKSSDLRLAYGVDLGNISFGLGFESHNADTSSGSTDNITTTGTDLLTNTLISVMVDDISSKTEWNLQSNTIILGSEFRLEFATIEFDGSYTWGERGNDLFSYTRTENTVMATSDYSLNKTTTRNGLDAGNGNPMGNYDIQDYGLDLAVMRDINNKFKVKGYAGFHDESHDLRNDSYVETITEEENTPLETANTFDLIRKKVSVNSHAFSGTVDEEQWYTLGLKGYYDFDDNVSFAFGFFYVPSDMNTDTPYTVTIANDTETFDTNGDGDLDDYDPNNGINDRTVTTTGSYKMNYSKKNETTTYSIPVAVEFKITGKLTIRVGARHSISKSETTESRTYVSGSEQTTSITTEADGTITATQNAYDIPDDEVDVDTSTSSSTVYNLGLGYAVSDNLDFSLMTSANSGNGETVNNDMDIFAQVTLRFN